MKLAAYLKKYNSLRLSLRQEKKQIELLKKGDADPFLARLSEKEGFPDEAKTGIEDLEKRFLRHLSLHDRYAKRIAKGCLLIPDKELQRLALYRFLYGFTQEEVAEGLFYSVRTMYRHQKKAEAALTKGLLSLMPSPVRLRGKRFRALSPASPVWWKKRMKKDAEPRRDWSLGRRCDQNAAPRPKPVSAGIPPILSTKPAGFKSAAPAKSAINS